MFQILDPQQEGTDKRGAFAARVLPATIGSLQASAPFFRPSPDLVAAVNVALSVGAPLLLTGEPGTGKTQVAYYLAWYFGLIGEDELRVQNGSADSKPKASFFQLDVRSTTTANDLLFHFDNVAYFHAASDPARRERKIDRAEFVQKGPLWKALEAGVATLVLIDEIDKAPRDFPNDLLAVLSENRFRVPEQDNYEVKRSDKAPPPFLVITSNSERRLPEPFLRRCIFHHIELTEDLLKEAVQARRQDFAELDDITVNKARARVMELRGHNLRKKPATGELLVWLVALAARRTRPNELDVRLSALPALSALIKDRDDLDALP
jgi:MoxR-like ATPase